MEYRIAGINATRLGISLMTVVRDPLQAAVRRTSVPPRLREQIQSAIRREAVRQARQRVFLAVAACAIAALAGSIGVQSVRLAPVLQVGLNDHVKCAAPRILPTHGPAIDTLSTEVGRDFAALIPVVQAHVPADYQLAIAHRCHFDGRDFVHLILRGAAGPISLIIARKLPGESLASARLAPEVEDSGLSFYQANAQSFAIAAFETRDELAYLISFLSREQNTRLMIALAPGVRDFLAK